MPEKQIISGCQLSRASHWRNRSAARCFDEDLRLEVEPRAQAEVLVAGSGVAVAAAMLAAAVGVQAEAEGDVRAVVFGDDALGPVGDELRARRRAVRQARAVAAFVRRSPADGGRIVLVVRLVLEGEEPIRGIDGRPASFGPPALLRASC